MEKHIALGTLTFWQRIFGSLYNDANLKAVVLYVKKDFKTW